VETVDRALRLFREDKPAWRALQASGMQQDHSWDVSAREYVKVYRGLFPGRAKRKVRNDVS
jgi:starch synthase